MIFYTTVVHSFVLEDDFYYPTDRQTITVSVEDERPVDTGLLDERGQKLYRVTKRERVGF